MGNNTIDLSKLPVSEGSQIYNIIALNSNGDVIKAETDFAEYITDEELDDRLIDYYLDGEVDEMLADKQDVLVSGTNIKTINGESILGEGDIEIVSEVKTDSRYTDYTVTAPVTSGDATLLQNEMTDNRRTHTYGFEKTFSAIANDYFEGTLTVGTTTEMCPSWDGTTLTFQPHSSDIWTVSVGAKYSDASGMVTISVVKIQSYLDTITISYGGTAASQREDKLIADVYGGRLASVYVNDTDIIPSIMSKFMTNGYASYSLSLGTSEIKIMPFNPLEIASELQDSYNITVSDNTTLNVYNSANVIEGSRYVNESSEKHPEGLNEYIRYSSGVKSYILTDKNIGNVTYTKDEIDTKISEGGSGNEGITEETDPVFTAWKDNTLVKLGGANAASNVTSGVIIGSSATTATNNAVAIGTNAQALLGGVAIGYNANAGKGNGSAIAIGSGATISARDSIAIGNGVTITSYTANSVAIGKSLGNVQYYDKLDGTVSNSQNVNTTINGLIIGDTSGYVFIKHPDGGGQSGYIRLQDWLMNPTLYYTKTEVDALIPEIKEWTGTQEEYDALTEYDANTTYYIIEG